MADEITTEVTLVAGLKITPEEFGKGSISSLADRPNASSTLGGGGLTADALKARFDQNPELIKNRLNALIEYIIDGTLANDLTATSGGVSLTLAKLLESILDGTLASEHLKAKKTASSEPDELDDVLDAISAEVATKLDAKGVVWNGDFLEAFGKQIWANWIIAGTEAKYAILENWGITIEDNANGKGLNLAFPEREAVDGAQETIATEKWVREEMLKLKIVSVEDYEKTLNDGTTAVYLKVTFHKEDEDGDKVIDIPLDSVFAGVDKLLKEVNKEIDNLSKDKANTSDVNALIDEAKDELDNKKLDKATAEWGTIKPFGLPSAPNNKLIVKGNEAGDAGYVEAIPAVPFTSQGDPYYALFEGTRITFANNYKDGNYDTRARVYLPSAYTPSSAKRNEILATQEYTDTAKAEVMAKTDEVMAKTDEVEKRVDKLEGMLVKKTVDDSTAYEKYVPEASAPKAILSSIGGYSTLPTNIFSEPEADADGILTIDGYAFYQTSKYPIGTYTIKVETLEGTVLNAELQGKFVEGDYIPLTLGSARTFTATGPFDLNIQVSADYDDEGTPISHAKLRVMLVEGRTLDFASAPVTAIVSKGTNYLDVEKLVGAACRKNADGSYTLEKTSEGNRFTARAPVSIPAGTRLVARVITKDYNLENENFLMQLIGDDYSVSLNTNVFGSYSSAVVLEKDIKEVYAYIQQGASKDGNYITFTAVELTRYYTYEDRPYWKKPYNIPNEILGLPGYGEGNPDNPDEYNWVDLVNDEYHHKGNIVDKVWVALEKEDIQKISPEAMKKLKGDKDYFFIEVQGGGTVRFENDYKMAVPSKITFAEVH